MAGIVLAYAVRKKIKNNPCVKYKMLYLDWRCVRCAACVAGLRVNQRMLFEIKKLSLLLLVGVESFNMNKQIYALKIKLASLTDAKKIAVLQLKIQQLEKTQK